jgi:hypothetical protein
MNKFYKNFGTAKQGLVHVVGMSRINFVAEEYIDNGDVHR